MTLSRALSSAYSGLTASAFRADVSAGNISNAGTAGYVRRTANLSESIVGGQGNGVSISGVNRQQDYQLTRLRRDADSASGRTDIIAQAYNDLNREMGAPGDEYGLFASYESFESSLRELSLTPESTALQNSVLSAATSLVNQFNDLSQMGNSLRTNADAGIARGVEIVNDALYQIQKLNGDISGMNQEAGDTAALEDERQRLLDTIAQYIPIKDFPREGGRIDVMTENGVFLLAGSVNELEFTPSGAIPAGASYADGIGGLSGLMVGDQELTTGAGNFGINSGVIAGYFSVRDSIAPEFMGQVDGLAADLISRFSDDALDPTKTAGAPGIFTNAGGPVDAANLPGTAARLRINATIDPAQGGEITRLRDGLGAMTPGASGNADILNNLLDAFTSANSAPGTSGLVGNFTSTELAAGVSSLVGENRVRADATAASSTSRSVTLYEAEIAKTAVDTDQELQSLLLIEQSYAANARVIQTVSDMLDRLMQI
ncbi:MAG: flagellar hook-associated protein FlgK [Acidimicrobiales bacterium]|nr:flagellar hook-associated protein FlgK [Hyphomonadaceae bacterium]RZV44785.1 MAG: flagellar hook-associated protein FlgK [Acidimicrobiales bacterium]